MADVEESRANRCVKASDTPGEDGNGGEEVGMSENHLGTVGLQDDDGGWAGATRGTPPPILQNNAPDIWDEISGAEDVHNDLELMGTLGANVWEGKQEMDAVSSVADRVPLETWGGRGRRHLWGLHDRNVNK